MSKDTEENIKKISSILPTLTNDEVFLFFKAFFTPSELTSLSNRYLIIKELLSGLPQKEIAKNLGVSSSKITAGSRELEHGVGREFLKKFINKS